MRVLRAKRLVFVLAAFGAALAGALWLATAITFQPKAYFSVQWTAYMIFMVLVGGLGTFEGPIIGAVIFFAIEAWFGARASGIWSASARPRSCSRCSCRAASGAGWRTRRPAAAAVGYRAAGCERRGRSGQAQIRDRAAADREANACCSARRSS